MLIRETQLMADAILENNQHYKAHEIVFQMNYVINFIRKLMSSFRSDHWLYEPRIAKQSLKATVQRS